MQQQGKWFYGWWVVIGGILIMAVMHSLLTTCWGLYVKPVTADMGFSRGAFALCSTIISGVTVFLSPYMGKWLAKKNTRLIHSICIIGMALSYAAFSLATSITHFYIIAFFMGAFSCGAVALPVSIIITNWFVKKRGLAISLALAGSGFGGAVISPIMTQVMQGYGWRESFVVFGILMAVVSLPMALFVMKKSPESMGLKPYGSEEASAVKAEKTANLSAAASDISLAEAKKQGFFWAYIFGIFALCFVGFGSFSQLAAYLADAHDPVFAAAMLSLFLIVVTPGKISLGWVYDKFGTRLGTAYICIIFILSFVCMLYPESKPLMYVMAVLYGLGICSGTVCPPVMTAAMFGSKHYGEIYGFINLFVYVGAALSVPAIALVYDQTGSYYMAWLLCIALCAVSLVALLYSDRQCRVFMSKRLRETA